MLTLISKIHFILYFCTYCWTILPPIPEQVVRIDGPCSRAGYLCWQILLLDTVCSFGSGTSINVNTKGWSSGNLWPLFHYKCQHHHKSCSLSFCSNRAVEKKKKAILTPEITTQSFFSINKEYRNTLIDSLVLNFPIWPLKSCLRTQGLQVHLSSSIHKSSIKFMPPFQRADLWYPFSPWVMIIKLEQRF